MNAKDVWMGERKPFEEEQACGSISRPASGETCSSDRAHSHKNSSFRSTTPQMFSLSDVKRCVQEAIQPYMESVEEAVFQLRNEFHDFKRKLDQPFYDYEMMLNEVVNHDNATLDSLGDELQANITNYTRLLDKVNNYKNKNAADLHHKMEANDEDEEAEVRIIERAFAASRTQTQQDATASFSKTAQTMETNRAEDAFSSDDDDDGGFDSAVNVFPSCGIPALDDRIVSLAPEPFRPYGCDCGCGRSFISARMLRRHQNIMTKRFTCPECKHSFKENSFLKRHMVVIHGAKTQSSAHSRSEKGRFITRNSSPTGSTSSLERTTVTSTKSAGAQRDKRLWAAVTKHMQTGYQENQFECGDCGRLVSSLKYLKQHKIYGKCGLGVYAGPQRTGR